MQDQVTLIQLVGGALVIFSFMFVLYLGLLLSVTMHYYDRGYELSEAFKKAKAELK